MGALQAMSPRGRIVLAVSALAIVCRRLHDASASPRRRATRRCRPASTRPRPARSPPRSTRPASPTSSQNNGTALAVVSGQESKARVALAGQGLGRRRLAARLRAARQAEARLLHLPAADRLPARPRGPDRPDHRADRRHLRRPGPAHAAQGRPLRRREAARHRGRAPQRRLHRARSRRRPRHRLAGLLQRAQPQARQRHDHRRVGLDAVAAGRRRRRRRHGLQAGGRGALRGRRCRASLGALIARTVGPDKAQVQVHADLNVDKATQEQLQYAKKGTPLETTKETESLKGIGQRRAAAPPARPPTSRPTRRTRRRPGGNSNYKRTTGKTTFGVDKTVTRKTDRARRRQQARRRRCWSTSRSRAAQADRAQAGRGRRRRHQPQARRHHDPEHGRLRQARGRPRPGRPARAARLRRPAEVRGHRPGEHPLPLLHDPRPAPSRAGGPADADVADRDRGPPPAGRARAVHERGAGAGRRRRAAPSPRRSTVDSLVQEQPERVAQQLRAWISEDPE